MAPQFYVQYKAVMGGAMFKKKGIIFCYVYCFDCFLKSC